MDKNKERIGVIITIIAGILWGFSGTCGQFIFENFDVDPMHLTSQRLLLSGIILTVIGFIKTPSSMVNLWKDKFSIYQLLMFSLLGITFNQLSYMEAIANSNSGTATILQYMGPVFIMIATCVLARRLPRGKEVISIILAITGTYLIATHGNIHTMVLTTRGLIWGLLSAFALTFYNMIPVRITGKYGSIAVTGYGMLIGGIVMSVYSKVWRVPFIKDPRYIFAFLAIIILGTVVTYTLYLWGVALCGPLKASMLASVEPVSATLFMVVWLKVPLYLIEVVGFVFIFATIIILAKDGEKEKKRLQE